MKYQRKIIKFIFGLVLVCAIISPALALELGVNVLPGELQIISTYPSETFEICVDEAQTLSIVLDRDVTAVWYENSVEIRTDHNTSNSSYYFTSSTEQNLTVDVFCTDSFTNTSQVNFGWFVSVIPAVDPHPTPPRANRPVTPYIPPAEPGEDIIDEEEIEEINKWRFPAYEIPKLHLPEELSVLSEVDGVIIGLVIAFLILFIIGMRGGPGKEAEPGRRAPIKR